MNRQLSGRAGPRGYMRLHGAWPLCMSVASGWAVWVQVGPITFSQTKHAHEIVRIRTIKQSLLHRANFIDQLKVTLC